VAGLAYGEMLDVERAFDTRLSLPDYLELAERKTGDLFRLSCRWAPRRRTPGRMSRWRWHSSAPTSASRSRSSTTASTSARAGRGSRPAPTT
jgi:hypothetical protein